MRMDQAAGPCAWLDASAVRTAPDVVLGVVLLSAAVAAFAGATALPFRNLDLPGSGFYPVVIAGLLAAFLMALATDPNVTGAIQVALEPRFIPYYVIAIGLITEVARRRTISRVP